MAAAKRRRTKGKRIRAAILISLILIVFLQILFPDFFTNIFKKSVLHIGSDTSQQQNNAFQNEKPTPPVTKIIIDPGHGGKDVGTEKGQVFESKITLDISKKLKSCLEDKSFEVELTRDADISLYTLSNLEDTMQRRELDARTRIIDKSGAKIFLSIHVNSYPKYPKMSGSIVYYNALIPESKKLAESIQKLLNEIEVDNFKRDTHKTQEADFYILKNSTIPGVLVETAFITNLEDRQLITQDSFQTQIAQAVANATEIYFQNQ